jgi:hypothetical protein
VDAVLKVLFFEGFAKPEDQRSAEARNLLGSIKYLNGGWRIPIEKHRDRYIAPFVRRLTDVRNGHDLRSGFFAALFLSVRRLTDRWHWI